MLRYIQYWAKITFKEHDRVLGGDSYLEISSRRNTSFEAMEKRQSEALATRFDEPPLCEFADCTIDEVYDFYKRHLRPADDREAHPHFSAFTFAVVDEECLRAEPQQLIVCSDAPDFGEADDAVVLKTMRIKATRAWYASIRVEELTRTPMEAEMGANAVNEELTVLKSAPMPPKLVCAEDQSESPDEVGDDEAPLYVFATPAQARAKKRAGIKAAESKGWVPGKGWADGIEGQSVPWFK